MEEQNRVSEAQQGSQEAFAALVHSYHRLVMALTGAYMGWKDAEDAAQQIWLAVWRKLWQLEDTSRFEFWLRKLVFNQCLNIRKARAKLRERETQLSIEAWAGLAEWAADDCLVEDIMEHRELRSLISRELDLLPGDYGMLLRLYYLQDLSYKQISVATGLPLSTLKWRLHQGRKLLLTNLTLHLKKPEYIRRPSND